MSDSLSAVEAALAHLLAGARPLEGRETLPADAALCRVLAEPMVSDVTVPPLDNSAMMVPAGMDLSPVPAWMAVSVSSMSLTNASTVISTSPAAAATVT